MNRYNGGVAVIAASASLSSAAYPGDNAVINILMPAAWTAADLTFQGSVDGVTYYNVLQGGAEYVVSSPAAASIVTVDPAVFQPFRYIKVRSGTAASAVVQAAARSLSIVTVDAPVSTPLDVGDNNIGNVDVATIAAGETHIGEVGGSILAVSVEFTRPANTTAYSLGDVVSNNATTTAPMTFTNLARVAAGSGVITRAYLVTDQKSVTPTFRVHLFNASTATLSGDNTAYQEKYTDASKQLGYFDLPAMHTPADTTNSTVSKAQRTDLHHHFVCAAASRTIYAVLEVLDDGFTPASGEKFTLTLVSENN